MTSWFHRRYRALVGAYRWRGPLIASLLVTRVILRPVFCFDIYRIFETDISQSIPEPYGRESVEVRVHASEEQLGATPEDLRAELDRDGMTLRFARGDIVGIAYIAARAVGYMWATFSDGLELGPDTQTFWIVRPHEAVRYGSYVLPAFRGRSIHSCLNSAMNSYLRGRGVTWALGAISFLNPQSMSLPKHYRRAISMTVVVARNKKLDWTIRKSFGAPLESRFSRTGSDSAA